MRADIGATGRRFFVVDCGVHAEKRAFGRTAAARARTISQQVLRRQNNKKLPMLETKKIT